MLLVICIELSQTTIFRIFVVFTKFNHILKRTVQSRINIAVRITRMSCGHANRIRSRILLNITLIDKQYTVVYFGNKKAYCITRYDKYWGLNVTYRPLVTQKRHATGYKIFINTLDLQFFIYRLITRRRVIIKTDVYER